MKQLTGLAAAFLMLERHNSTGHVVGVCLLDPTEAPAYHPRAAPSTAQLLVRASTSRLASPVNAVRITKDIVRSLPVVGSYVTPCVGAMLGRGTRDGDVIATAPGLAPRTPFNKAITAYRRTAGR